MKICFSYLTILATILQYRPLIHFYFELQQEDFRKVVNSRGVRENLFKLADADCSGDITVEEVIDFLVVLSKPRHTDDFDCDKIRRIEEIFKANLPPNQNALTLTEFKNIMASKNAFFVERVFKIFDIGNVR